MIANEKASLYAFSYGKVSFVYKKILKRKTNCGGKILIAFSKIT